MPNAKDESLFTKYVKQNTETTVKMMFESIVRLVEEGDFERAEVMRQKLIEVDPMALTEIIRSGEIIEEQRRERIDSEHLEVWAELYKNLTPEETNALYYSLKEATFEAHETIYRQGNRNDRLYFINRGSLIVVYHHGGREVMLKRLNRGDVAGKHTFFYHSLCTTSLMAFSRAQLSYLERAAMESWKEKYPALESKLSDYCQQLEQTEDLLKKRNLDRRTMRRVKISGKAVFRILGPSGEPVGGAFKGELSDISVGGLSFWIHITRTENARLLLGRSLNIQCLFAKGRAQKQLDQVGTVMAVRSYPFGDFSVHVKFSSLLEDSDVFEIERLAKTG